MSHLVQYCVTGKAFPRLPAVHRAMPGLKEAEQVLPESPASELLVFVNGKKRVLPYGAAEKTLLQWLRGVP